MTNHSLIQLLFHLFPFSFCLHIVICCAIHFTKYFTQSEHIRCSGLNTETSDLADESMNMSTSTSSSNINNTNITDVPNNANNNTTITTDDVASNSNSTGDGTANTNGNSNGNRNSSHDAYINKYLPGIWSELKNANADKYLLTLKKLQIPAQQLDASLKICILNYLNAIEPIAFVNASQLLNNSCGYMVIREHVSVLHTISTRSFRCLKSYKISISNAYVNTTQVTRYTLHKHPNCIWLQNQIDLVNFSEFNFHFEFINAFVGCVG